MICICGADELVIGSIHQIPDFFNLSRHLVNKLFGRNAGLGGFLLDLLTMFIGSGLEADIVALFPAEAGNAVCQHDFISIPDMGLA